MRKLIIILCFILTGCGTNPSDLHPIVNGEFKDAKKVYYPSTDYKASAVIIDKSGNVYYIRLNAIGELRDRQLLFNVYGYCNTGDTIKINK